VLLAILAVAPGGGSASADPIGAPSGLFDVGGGRRLYLDCQGAGVPTVFIIPGKGSYAEAWNVVVPPDDPVRSSPYDLIEQAKLGHSPDAVQPTGAHTTRVCAYDRPNTRPDGRDLSTPVPQPHSVQQDVDDAVALIAAAQLAGPFVVVAHSYGGLVADLRARTHPELVAGLVMVDPTSEFLPALGSPAQNAAFNADGLVPPEPGGEAVLFDDAFARINAAPPLPRVPAVVVSSDKFAPPEKLTPDSYTLAQIHEANDMLAAALDTTNVVANGGGHSIMLYQLQFVADKIITTVRAAADR